MDAFKIATLAGLYALLLLGFQSCTELQSQQRTPSRIEEKVFDTRLEVIRGAR